MRISWTRNEHIVVLHYFHKFGTKQNEFWNEYLEIFASQQNRDIKKVSNTFSWKLANYQGSKGTSKKDLEMVEEFKGRTQKLEEEFARIQMGMMNVISRYATDEFDTFQEGEVHYSMIKKRHRSRKLKKLAIEKYGMLCEICKLDLEKKYGKHAVAHVHHKKPLFMNEEPVENTLKDVAVLCATCHSCIHKNSKQPLNFEVAKNTFHNN